MFLKLNILCRRIFKVNLRAAIIIAETARINTTATTPQTMAMMVLVLMRVSTVPPCSSSVVTTSTGTAESKHKLMILY